MAMKFASIETRWRLRTKQITLNFKKMKTIENPGVDYIMIATILLYILIHFVYGVV
jgi:hypothetical protein